MLLLLIKNFNVTNSFLEDINVFYAIIDSMNNFSGSEVSYKKIHEELNACIGTLDEKIDGMIEKHEKDFMVAYRVCSHIYIIFFRVIC